MFASITISIAILLAGGITVLALRDRKFFLEHFATLILIPTIFAAGIFLWNSAIDVTIAKVQEELPSYASFQYIADTLYISYYWLVVPAVFLILIFYLFYSKGQYKRKNAA